MFFGDFMTKQQKAREAYQILRSFEYQALKTEINNTASALSMAMDAGKLVWFMGNLKDLESACAKMQGMLEKMERSEAGD